MWSKNYQLNTYDDIHEITEKYCLNFNAFLKFIPGKCKIRSIYNKTYTDYR